MLFEWQVASRITSPKIQSKQLWTGLSRPCPTTEAATHQEPVISWSMGSFADSAPAPKGVETQKPASKQAPFSQWKSAQYDANVGITQNAGKRKQRLRLLNLAIFGINLVNSWRVQAFEKPSFFSLGQGSSSCLRSLTIDDPLVFNAEPISRKAW